MKATSSFFGKCSRNVTLSLHSDDKLKIVSQIHHDGVSAKGPARDLAIGLVSDPLVQWSKQLAQRVTI
jgi:hypothetical protein